MQSEGSSGSGKRKRTSSNEASLDGSGQEPLGLSVQQARRSGERVADQEQAELRLQVARVRQEHADFDAAINAMEAVGCDRLAIQRMKKKKLVIKDKLQDLEDQVIPDIIA